MLATVKIFLFAVLTVAGTRTPGNNFITTGRPRDCNDILRQGNDNEGHYVVYPVASSPDKARIIFCSQEDGMEPQSSGMTNLPQNCLDILENGQANSGPSIIYPFLEYPNDPVMIFCDQETEGGGWAVIQYRYDGSEDFYRSYDEYADGFGDANEEHYIGNGVIAALTGQCVNELLVEVSDWDDINAYAHYQSFHMANFTNSYRLAISLYNGNAGDSLQHHLGASFSTFDLDHDGDSNNNCAENKHGAWWYNDPCRNTYSNLNGRYYPSANPGDAVDYIRWYTYRGSYYSLKTTKMMVRPYPGPA